MPGIPRAKLKSANGVEDNNQQQHRSIAVSRLHDYLDDGLRIPRVHLDRDDDAYDSTSQSSSEYTVCEEVERRIITDVTKKETTKTLTTADIHGTTAEFHVYPPIEITTEIHPSSQTGVRDGSLLLVDKVERERGESVAEFSIGNAHHDWNSAAERNYDFSTDRDLESAMSDLTAEDDIYDKKTSVKRMHDYEPGVDGSTERYRTEMTTTTLSKGFSKH